MTKATKNTKRRFLFQSLETRRVLTGPYAPAAGQPGSSAIAHDDPAIIGWATGVTYNPGSNVDAEFQTQNDAVGPADANAQGTVSLGRGGQITLEFDNPIRDGLGHDFAVFENGFDDSFLELAFVEVSSNGVDFIRFPSDSLTETAVDAFGAIDPTEVNNLAGKYRQGFGTPFDLDELVGNPMLDTTRVTHVRIVDVVGNGTTMDSSGNPIFDPFPTVGSAGFDLDAVGVLHQVDTSSEVVDFEDVGQSLATASAFNGPDPNGTSINGAFNDTATVGSFSSERLTFSNVFSQDFGSWNGWAYSNVADNTTPGFGNQFGSFAGGGVSGSSTFGIGFQDINGFYELPTISREVSDTRSFDSIMITNTTYAALSMRNGDAFAKQFGGASGNDPDFLLLTIDGKDANDISIGQIEFYLADYRFGDNAQDYIVDEWTRVDLSPIANARELEFSFTSSDVGPFGINTPVYFAADDIAFSTFVLPIDLADSSVAESAGSNATTARVSRPTSDTSREIEVTLSADEGVVVPDTVTIPSGQRFVEFAVGVSDDSIVNSNRSLQITASADEFADGTTDLMVQEDDLLTLATLPTRTVNEGTSFDVSITRNDGNVSSALTVQLSSNAPNVLSFPSEVTIQAGQASATVSVEAVRDFIDRDDIQANVTMSAEGYVSVQSTITISDVDNPTVSLSVAGDLTEANASSTIGFENLAASIPSEGFYNGSDLAGGFQSGGLSLNNDFNPIFGSWSGWAYSNTTDTTTPGFLNQYSAFPGQGAMASETYAVASAFTTPTITRDPTASNFQSLSVTNTTYAALSMMQGDAFAKQFGGESGDDPDFFLLTITGLDANDESIGTIDFYLADFRASDHSLDYIVDEWTTVDLTPIAAARSLSFSLSSSDVGSFGMNTPAYFAVDEIKLATDTASPILTVGRNTPGANTALEVQLTSSDSSELVVPESVVIPAGQQTVAVPLRVENDAWFDGDQTVNLTASATNHVGASIELNVTDNDAPTLSLTALTPKVSESEEGRMFVYHNIEDVSFALELSLEQDPEDELEIPDSVIIPQGQRRLEVAVRAIDNIEIDGDRSVTVTATTSGLIGSSDVVMILNDDFPPPQLTLELDQSQIGESDAPPRASLEDAAFRLAGESFYNGADFAGGFQSGPATFNNSFESTFGSWSGFALANTTDTTTPGFTNQYSAFAGQGANDTESYAVANAFPGGFTPRVSIDPDRASEFAFDSLMITNTTYAALSMRDGDAFAKQFGGESGNDPDFFLLTIEGLDQTGQSVGTVDFYLADFRGASEEDYIIDEWTQVDVSELVGATELTFALSSSDVGDFGMNTPAYFAIDEILFSSSSSQEIVATVSRHEMDLSEDLVVDIQVDTNGELDFPATITIPANESQTTFTVSTLDDHVVDGDRMIQLSVSADTHIGDSAEVTVSDNDQLQLSVVLTSNQVPESAGEVASELVIHRNTADLALSQTVSLTGESGIVIADSAEIPAGETSVRVPIEIVDNQIVDGPHSYSIQASATDYESASVEIEVVDDDLAGLVVAESDGSNLVTEAIGNDSVEISLSSQPLSRVVIDVSADDPSVQLAPNRVEFTPENWGQAQTVTIQALFDWEVTQDRFAQLSFVADATESDAAFGQIAESIMVSVIDHQPSVVRVTENEQQIWVVDSSEDTLLSSSDFASGIEISTNDLNQEITLDPLVSAIGLITVDSRGGDDVVILRSTRFTSLNGGAGTDRLVVQLDEPVVNFVPLLDNRVLGFEEIVVQSDELEQLIIDTTLLDRVLGSNVDLTVRLSVDQRLTIPAAVNTDPEMVGDELAQVLQVGESEIHVFSEMSWQNAVDPLDVDRNTEITPFDALLIINALSDGITELQPLVAPEMFDGAFYDVTGEGELSPLDALLVINRLTQLEQAAGQAEFVSASAATGFIAPASRSNDSTDSNSFTAEPIELRSANRVVSSNPETLDDEAIDLVMEGSDQILEVLAKDRVEQNALMDKLILLDGE